MLKFTNYFRRANLKLTLILAGITILILFSHLTTNNENNSTNKLINLTHFQSSILFSIN